MRIALLANPDAGSGEAAKVGRMLRQRGAEVARFGLDRAAELLASRPDRVVVAGGDGSVAPAAEAAAAAAVPLAVVPVGTANDFARALELPLETEAAVELAVAGRRTRRLDLGRMERRAFVNAASAGLSPLAARKARGLKPALGSLAYALAALRVGLTARPLGCRVWADRTPAFSGAAWQVTVAVTGAFGAGADVGADPADGMLDVVVIEEGPRALLVCTRTASARGG